MTAESFRSSLERIAASLPEKEREDFRMDIFTFGEPAEMYGYGLAAEARRPPEPRDAFQLFHGMTAAELHAKAVRFRAARDKRDAEAKARRDATRREH